MDFILDQGIRKQMNAFRKGFNAVFPIERLGSFAPAEVSSLISYSYIIKEESYEVEKEYFVVLIDIKKLFFLGQNHVVR